MTREEQNTIVGSVAQEYADVTREVACLSVKLERLEKRLIENAGRLRRGQFPREINMDSNVINGTIREMQDAMERRERLGARLCDLGMSSLVTHSTPAGMPESVLLETGGNLSPISN